MAGGAETPNIAALPAIARLGTCESARGPDANRHVKPLSQFAVEGRSRALIHILADIDADRGDRDIGCPRQGELLVFGAPCQLRLLAGQEHGRTIPLSDIRPLGPVSTKCASPVIDP
jgi:hypothetical protein